MIPHIVMWDLLRCATAEERLGNSELLRRRRHALRGRIPGLLPLEVGVDFWGVDCACDVVCSPEAAGGARRPCRCAIAA